MRKMGESGSVHVVRLLRDPVVAEVEGVDEEGEEVGDGVLWGGDGGGVDWEEGGEDAVLIPNLFSNRNLPFKELALWRIFECLVDGCTVMEHGSEYETDADGVPQIPATSPIYGGVPDPGILVQFDLKPENIMNGDWNPPDHLDTPVCKIGDFGMAHYFPRGGVMPWGNWAQNEEFRYLGTTNYQPPEQFSDRWNYSDYITGNICGRYGTKTNVWGIGQIMY
ncbi:hypothetical protein DL98DRAFT_573782, partial [Cadophora sp. DSE1049]